MASNYRFFYLFLGCLFLTITNCLFSTNIKAEDFSKAELKTELTKGNFLIGLKQYLGGKNDSFSNNKTITFTTENGFLNLSSSNGVNHKSKKISIVWRDIPLKNPYSVERFVFGPFASFESAQKKSQYLRDNGFNTTIANPNFWEVWIPFESNLLKNESDYKISRKKYSSQITPFISTQYTFQKLEGPIYINADEEIKINNINFGNKFYLVKDLYGTWTLIQKIKFDNYLEGVLPYEIGSNSPLEALKAQAVIARTWGIYNFERFNMDKYHLCITTQCQVYKKPKFENKEVQKAIKETSNLILIYDNKPINSFYHGSNGGVSAQASESWNIEDNSYFKIKLDGKKSLNKSFKVPFYKESELSTFLDSDIEQFYGSDHSRFRWSKQISSAQVAENLIKKKLIHKNENVLDLNVIERGLSGRVIKLEIKTTNLKKPIFLFKDDIRRILSFLPSNLFTINKLNDNLWFFKGGGSGHGVGLSQSGAIEMAELGFTYDQILNHYYPGTELRKIEIFSK